MAARSTVAIRPGELYDLQSLYSLPCGCIVSLSRAKLLELTVVRLEAKGPYCPVPAHRLGSVVDARDEELDLPGVATEPSEGADRR